MTMISKTRNMLEGLVREGSFSWVLSRSSFNEEFEEMGKSPSGQRKWISELSPLANVIVGRCSRILNVSMDELQLNFDTEASNSMKHPSCYARNFLEYCCLMALALSSQVTGHLGDKNFWRLTYDMMLAWEAPGAPSQPLVTVDVENTVGKEAFSRIAPAIPAIADVITSSDLFDVLTASTRGRLSFCVYEKYLCALERAIKKMKTQSESSILSGIRLPRGERILDIDGTVTTQPVLQHVGTSAWPGRLTLTDHALYFEPLRVVSYDMAKTYDLSNDLRQVVKPELTGPWGTRLFDKAVMYKSISLPEPVVMEFPQLSRNFRRDYWLAIIREILYAHKFIRKHQIKGIERDEALSKAVLGILRLQAIHEIAPAMPQGCEVLLMFNLADQLPGGDLILETLANMSSIRESDRTNNPTAPCGMYSTSALAMLSNFGIAFGAKSHDVNEVGLLVSEVVVGKMSALERAVYDSRNSFKKMEHARATIHGVKVEGVDKNLAMMKALLLPISEIGNYLLFLASWDDPLKSLVFCSVFSHFIYRGWIGRAFTLLMLFTAIFMVLTRCFSQGRSVEEVMVIALPAMNTMDQLLAAQNVISHIEEFVKEGNIILLKLRALLLAICPQATERLVVALVLVALVLAILPGKFVILLIFLEMFTRNSPPRKASTERWTRRLREWWVSIPAAPVILERTRVDKKRRYLFLRA